MIVRHRVRNLFFRATALIVFLLATSHAYAQRGGLRGKIVDDKGKPIEGVEVVIERKDGGFRARVRSNAKGEYLRAGLRPGTYRLMFSRDGYQPVLVEMHVSAGKPETVDRVTLVKLPEGALTETAHKEAQGALAAASKATAKEDYEGAIESLRKFLEVVPDSPEAYFNIAANYEKMGDKDEALVNYKKATEVKPDFFDAYVAIADLHASEKRWQQAMEAMEKALELRPDDKVSLFNYGAYSMNSGHPDKAAEAFQKLVDADPSYALAHYELGMVKASLGQNDEAAAHLQKYLELEPEGDHAATAKQILGVLKKKS